MNYFHISSLLKYIKVKEGKDFQIIKSEDYGIEGILSFKAIIPAYYEIDKINVKEDEYAGYIIEIKDKMSRNIMSDSNIIFWNSELGSTEDDKNSYILLDEVDNGVLVFEKFKNIPEYISSEELKSFLDRG